MKRILVIVDAQNDFITGSLANAEAQKKVQTIADIVLNEDWDSIVLTRDTHDASYLESAEGKKLPVEHCIKGTDGWEVCPIVRNAVEKKCSGSRTEFLYEDKMTFGDYSLPGLVRQLGKGDNDIQICMCGFCTDICVVSNALILKSVFYESGNVTVYGNACAGTTVSNHNSAIDTMRSCQIDIAAY